MGVNTPSDFPYHIVNAARTTFNKEFREGQIDETWKSLCTEVPSTKSKEVYAMLGATPKMREWIDERLPKLIKEYGFEILNKKYEASIAITEEAIEDDQTGQIMLAIRDLANEARRFPGERAMEVLVGGVSAECYDGQYFFDTDHSEGASGTQSNDLTLELTSDNLATVRATMLRYKDDKGKPMGIVGDTLIVPPELEKTSLELIGATEIARYVASGTDSAPTINVHRGKYTVIVNPFITDVDSWYFACCNRPTKPLIYQTRRAPRFITLGGTGSVSDDWFNSGVIKMGVDARFNIGYGNWRYCIACVPTS
ncbi:hypothetical protein MSHOH_1462 [Methanosarcina horonobensis HB-1 = JCM 15518]|uniref:Bacteriophage Mu GpT domain-containing protein n=1 Tax=Methanosarcina horonobensis HB-1 = JCM 15518 TaxID=1434110 RepID=A0A0E3WTJ1_9EURY|nr:Mu-like prophage major head subunit gpT family protein [Methanosarcina horonobensis]AKB77945.1 hypothetical protein MSHOH_1462 [Methanosarcina horonobensis HB-1 = JCM 15518]